MDLQVFNVVVYVWIGIAILILPVLLKITAPYGRHSTSTWGPMIDNKLGWVLMELPSLLTFTVLFLIGPAEKDSVKWILFVFWTGHYVNRVFIYPLRTKTKNKKMPISIMFMAVFFNLMNGFLNGYWLGFLSPVYPDSWMRSPQLIIGSILFFIGFIINQDSDMRLLKLRKKSTDGYSIPLGGLFKYISCPNFFGEIVEWAGFAIIAWNLPAFSFFLWSFVNLLPRALSHHKWYKGHFDKYPKERKAVFPFIL